MKNKFFFAAGIVGMLSGVAFCATDGAEVDYGREGNPYVTLRGGCLFGDLKFNVYDDGDEVYGKTSSFKSAWLGSGEFGVSCCNDRVLIGLELGYLATGYVKVFEQIYNPPEHEGAGADAIDVNYRLMKWNIKDFFGACNVTLRNDLNGRVFLYGGVGAGVSKREAAVKLFAKYTDAAGRACEKEERETMKKNGVFSVRRLPVSVCI